MSVLKRQSVSLLALALVTVSNVGCSPARSSTEYGADETADGKQPTSPEDSDETKGGETYANFDERRDAIDPSRGSVGEYGCTQDCSGHGAGYAWAEQRDITDPDDCGGKSWSFEEGCKAYAEEHAKDSED